MKKVFKVIGVIILGLLYILVVNMIIVQVSEYHILAGNNKEEDYQKIIEKIVVKDDVIINHKTANDYITLKDLKIRNDFKNFKQTYKEEDYVSYEYKDLKNKIIVCFKMEVNDWLVNASYSSTFLEKYNITNDMEYIKVLKEYKYFKTKINYKKLEYNAEARRGADSYYLDDGYYNPLTGYYKGFIKHDIKEDKTVVYIYHNDETYELHFEGTKFFSDSYIYDLISTVEIG